MLLHGTSHINERGHLEIGGCDTVDLIKQFGTPLIVYDEQHIRLQCRRYVQTLQKLDVPFKVSYASKAFSSMYLLQIIKDEGLSLDVVSGGELYTAIKANFPMEKVLFHGNNKSMEELTMALEANVGYFVIDNFYEIELLSSLCQHFNKHIHVLLRITPGVHASTHKFIQTGQEDSKFGFDLISGQAHEAVRRIQNIPLFNFVGLHMHIGSQIFDAKGYCIAISKAKQFVNELQLDTPLQILNIGGGFGIRYTEEDQPLPIESMLTEIVTHFRTEFSDTIHELPELWIEPGRSIVGEAGTTLYSIGASKSIPGVRNFLAVDGGMSDNIRPALYQARYNAFLANRALDTPEETYSIAGKLCETGDMLIWDIVLPKARAKDILAVGSTGAYGYSMASNYNKIPRPAVVFVKDGKAEVAIKRETYDNLIQNECVRQSKVPL